MPHTRVYVTWADHLMEAIAFLLLLGIWIFTLFHINSLPSEARSGVYTVNGVLTFTVLFIGGCAYAPLRFYNLPFRLTEYNYITQYVLATRLCRGAAIGIVLLMGCLLVNSFNAVLNLDPQIVSYLTPGGIILAIIPFAIYYLYAYRLR